MTSGAWFTAKFGINSGSFWQLTDWSNEEKAEEDCNQGLVADQLRFSHFQSLISLQFVFEKSKDDMYI